MGKYIILYSIQFKILQIVALWVRHAFSHLSIKVGELIVEQSSNKIFLKLKSVYHKKIFEKVTKFVKDVIALHTIGDLKSNP